jgi:hypothetical protein
MARICSLALAEPPDGLRFYLAPVGGWRSAGFDPIALTGNRPAYPIEPRPARPFQLLPV